MLKVDQHDRALRVLRNAGWNAVTEKSLIVGVKDEPGAIAVSAEPLEKSRALVKDELLARDS